MLEERGMVGKESIELGAWEKNEDGKWVMNYAYSFHLGIFNTFFKKQVPVCDI